MSKENHMKLFYAPLDLKSCRILIDLNGTWNFLIFELFCGFDEQFSVSGSSLTSFSL